MGVHDLWPILDPVGCEIPLTDLAGKKVAVDLGGWVVQSKLCKGLSTSYKPHLKNLFFRVSYLLKNGVLPVFIMEGEAPELKKNVIAERNMAASSKYSKRTTETKEGSNSRNKFDEILKECQNMLDTLGVPCLKSSGEGEAYCAYLNSKGLVDGCISNDNDAFLYGAEVVYKDFTIDSKNPRVREFTMEDIKNDLKLDRRKLVALALLLGCDYIKGVPGIGRERALKFLEELKDVDALERFKQWKELPESELFPSYDFFLDTPRSAAHCENCGHPGSSSKHQVSGCDICRSSNCCHPKKDDHVCSCSWHQNAEIKRSRKNELKIYQIIKEMVDFPEMKVVEEYLNYSDDIPDENCFVWTEPNLLSFQVGVDNWLRWTVADVLEKMLPIITTWQITQLCQKPSSCGKEFLFSPVRISQTRKRKGEALYEVKWMSNDEQHKNVSLCTWEKIDMFSKAYPEVTQNFIGANKFREERRKWRESRKTRSSPKKKKNSNDEDHTSDTASQHRKIEEFFPTVAHATGSGGGDIEGVSEQNIPTSPTRKRPTEEIPCGSAAKLFCVEDKDSQSNLELIG